MEFFAPLFRVELRDPPGRAEFLDALDAFAAPGVSVRARESFRVLAGPGLRPYFPEWEEWTARVRERVGELHGGEPELLFARAHIQRHEDDEARVELGLRNVYPTNTFFWRGSDLAAHARFGEGEAVLLNARERHSVAFNDTYHRFAPRASLIWRCRAPFAEIAARLSR